MKNVPLLDLDSVDVDTLVPHPQTCVLPNSNPFFFIKWQMYGFS